MTELSKPEVIITHESDLDGLLAGVLLQRLAAKLFGADVPARGVSLQLLETARTARVGRVGGRFHLRATARQGRLGNH